MCFPVTQGFFNFYPPTYTPLLCDIRQSGRYG